MKSSRFTLLTLAGFILLLIALFCSTITLASSDYRTVLTIALLCSLSSVTCFTIVLIRATLPWRITAAIGALAALWIILDVLRRST